MYTRENEMSELFSADELAIFKAYLEENNVKSDNIFEFNETNLSYYASRYTSEEYVSLYEMAHVNSFYHDSSEFIANRELLEKAKQWHMMSVHPEHSDYVLEGDKYVLHESLPGQVKGICNQLQAEQHLDFYTTDLLLMYKNKIYQYLPGKNFVFKWKDNMEARRKVFEQAHGFLFGEQQLDLNVDSVVALPVFIPIRAMLFLGETGYRSALLNHGAILHYIECELHTRKYDYFSNIKLNDWLQIDGVERSVISYFITCKGEEDGYEKK